MKNNTTSNFNHPIVLLLTAVAIAILFLTFTVEVIKALITLYTKVSELLKDTYGECLETLYNDLRAKLVNYMQKAHRWVFPSQEYIYAATFQNYQSQADIDTVLSNGYKQVSKFVNDTVISVQTFIGNLIVGSPFAKSINYFVDDELFRSDRVITLTELTPSPQPAAFTLHEEFTVIQPQAIAFTSDQEFTVIQPKPQTHFFVSDEEFTVIQPQAIAFTSDQEFTVIQPKLRTRFFISDEEFTVIQPQGKKLPELLELPELPDNWKKMPQYRLKAICMAVNKVRPKSISGHSSKKATPDYLIQQITKAYQINSDWGTAFLQD